MSNELGVFSQASVRTQPELSQHTLQRVARLLHQRSGIVLGEHKEDVIKRRLGVYATRLQLGGIDAYLDYLERHPQEEEWQRFVNVFTINHTAFFREQHHFKTLAQYLPLRSKPIHMWSAAASTGEEVYSMAMTAFEALPQPEFGVHILASDIDTEAIKTAKRGVYRKERVSVLSIEHLRRFFQRGTGANLGQVRVKSFLKEMVDFQVINLIDEQGWPARQSMDVIFCRNTLIYFDKSTQIQLLERFAHVLKPGGLLFVGHSENFSFLTSVLRLRGQTVYERP